MTSDSVRNNGTSPLISVAMCTYNGEKYLEKQIDSILAQSYENIELIIVDDCSRDGTAEILNRYQQQDPRIRVVFNSKNIGFIKNFERSLEECSGSLIALSDQDDIWLPDKIKVLAGEIADNLLVYSKVGLIDANDNPLPGQFPRVKRIDGQCALSLIPYNSVTGHTCLLRRELLELAIPFPENLFSHDQWIAIAAAASGRLKASEHTLSLYRLHGGNTLVGKRNTTTQSKVDKYLRNYQKILDISAAVTNRKLLNHHEQSLLDQFAELYKNNIHCYYNVRLSRFLRKHSMEFLAMYGNQDRTRRKLCRGVKLVKVLDLLARDK